MVDVLSLCRALSGNPRKKGCREAKNRNLVRPMRGQQLADRSTGGSETKEGIIETIQDAALLSRTHTLSRTQRSSLQIHAAPSLSFCDSDSLWNRTIGALCQPIIILGEAIAKSRHYRNIGRLDSIPQDQQQNNNNPQNPQFR